VPSGRYVRLPYFALWLALTPLPRRGRVVAAVLFTAALFWSIWVQQLGAWTYPCASWNGTPSVDKHPERLWSLRDTQIARCTAQLGRKAEGP